MALTVKPSSPVLSVQQSPVTPARPPSPLPALQSAQPMRNNFRPENAGRRIATGLHKDALVKDQLSLPLPDDANVAPETVEVSAHQTGKSGDVGADASADVRPLMQISKRTALFTREGAPELKFAYVTHHPGNKPEGPSLNCMVATRSIAKSASNDQPKDSANSVSFQNVFMTQKKAAVDESILRKLLMENDVVMLESNLGKNSGEFAYDLKLFEGAKAKVIFFNGGPYAETAKPLETLKNRMGPQLLSDTPYTHKTLRTAFTPDFWRTFQD